MSQREIVTLTGKTGRGKSFLTKQYLVKKISKNEPVIVADSMGEYKDPGFLVFESFTDFYGYAKSHGLKNAVYVVKILSDADAKKVFAFSCKGSFKHTLVIEEASKYCSPHSVDEFLNSIVSYGRHWGVSAIFSAQRFAQLNKIITSQSDYFITFQQTEKVDLNAVSNYFNETEKVKNLNKQEFVVFGDLPEASEFEADQILTFNSKKNKIQKK